MCTYLDTVGSTYYFRRVVPLELRPFILTRTGKPRTEWKISLGTKDRAEAKRLRTQWAMQTDHEIDRAQRRLGNESAQEAPQANAQALSGRAARHVAAMENAMHEAAEFAEAEADARQRRRDEVAELVEHYKAAMKGSTREMPPHLRAIAYANEDELDNRNLLREQLAFANMRIRVLEGAEPVLTANSAIRQADPRPASPAPVAVPLIDLFDSYAKEQGMSPVTAQDWKGVLRSLVRFVGHDDAARLTVEDIDSWRDMLLSETTKRGGLRSPRTVKDKYLSALRSTLNYAVSKRKLPENVASKVTVRIPRQPKLRERDFTNAEVASILSATLKPQTDAAELTQRARRWIPWLCAYTGARVNEISQLRGSDVAEVEGVWTIHITPEAGRVKSGEARTVPLHPHLIEQGFLALVDQVGDGALFYDPGRVRKPGAANRHVSKVGERLAAWVRQKGGVADPNVSPNHGWRHLFKTRALEAGMPERFMDAIQGHAARSVGQTYGRVPIKTLAEALAKLPRFDID